MMVIGLAGRLDQVRRHDPGVDPEPLAKSPPKRVEDSGRLAQRPGQGLRRFLDIGEMVALRLDMVAHPGLGRDRRGLVRNRPGRMLPPFDERGVEARDGVGDRRRVVGDLEQFVARDADAGEHRVGEDLAELVDPGPVRPFGREGAQVDVIDFGEAKQHLGGHRPLVALEMIEVAG